MFDIGDKIFYPMHGAGVIEDIVEKEILGDKKQYYVMRIPCSNMEISIPAANLEAIGVRRIVDKKTADDALEYLRSHEVDYNNNWNVRYRENLNKVKCGDIFEVCAVVKSLMLRERVKNLSTGERKMLSSAKNILVSELLLAMNCSYEAVDAQIDRIINAI